MKTKFEGTINGKKYDSVEEYNKAITGLIDSGTTQIEASSRTWLEPEDTDQNKQPNEVSKDTTTEQDPATKQDPTGKLPNVNSFVHELNLQKDLDTLTGLAKDRELINKYAYTYKTDNLESAINDIVKYGLTRDYADIIDDEYSELNLLSKSNKDALRSVENIIQFDNNEIDQLEELIETYKRQIKDLTNDIADKTLSKNVLINAQKIIDIKDKYLSKASSLIRDKAEKPTDTEDDPTDDEWPMTFSELCRRYFS